MNRRVALVMVVVVMCLSIDGRALAAAADPITVTVQTHGGSAPAGAQRVPVLTLRVDVPCGETAMLSSLTVRHRGLGDVDDIRGVYAVMDGRRVSRSTRLGRDGLTTIRLRMPAIAPCGEARIDVLGDIADDAAADGEHRWELESMNAVGRVVMTSASRSSTATSVRAGRTRGTITVESLPLLLPVRYGKQRTVARLRLRATEADQQLLSVTLTNGGSARDLDLQNLALRSSRGQVVTGTVDHLDNDRVTLNFTPPFLLERNATIVLELRADVRASRRRTIRFEVEEPADVEAEPCIGKRACVQAH